MKKIFNFCAPNWMKDFKDFTILFCAGAYFFDAFRQNIFRWFFYLHERKIDNKYQRLKISYHLLMKFDKLAVIISSRGSEN